MPAILIHGVPDTHRVWDGVRQHLSRTDVEAWDLPGFGAARPEGFGSSKDEYVQWLIARLEGIGEPVDLVGHDWGCILTARVASLRPDLIRTWAGGNGPVSAAYVWHPLAKIWQDADQGDAFMAGLDVPSLVELVRSFDVAEEAARETARHLDDEMKDSILKLYRSALTVGAEWEPDLAKVTAPGLVFWGKLDPACQVEFADRLGAAINARVLHLDCNHWTVLERPAEVAAALEEHWAGTGSH
ncbi:alpha/beta fold hydrolase [Streptomyces justiciae]|uniref:Alpha/beta hydrolase n=1 Tax=Streptomyces justiciae TaxID=2780140 RepID=A0ABU3M7T2_9ACTN|nr:alpha/beta hydrolase [Streptomyces justiciae]MDT7847495.1 alpha/beta hydrolase [Streptomyces justiciae]